ncbi:protein of unknown function [Rhodovastum atsumiense]|nr:hypothetical protein [Rhodovastum atsumiense]CAH2599898.1 protein of unknown function [Rhodovastum atsumiense]
MAMLPRMIMGPLQPSLPERTSAGTPGKMGIVRQLRLLLQQRERRSGA